MLRFVRFIMSESYGFLRCADFSYLAQYVIDLMQLRNLHTFLIMIFHLFEHEDCKYMILCKLTFHIFYHINLFQLFDKNAH